MYTHETIIRFACDIPPIQSLTGLAHLAKPLDALGGDAVLVSIFIRVEKVLEPRRRRRRAARAAGLLPRRQPSSEKSRRHGPSAEAALPEGNREIYETAT